MFPLNWNIPFIRKNGSRTTLGAITGDIAGIEEDVEELTEKTDGLFDNMLKNGAVNYCNFTAATETKNGYTFTNTNGVVHVTGSRTEGQTGNVDFNKTISLKAGTYKLTGCPTGGSADTWRLLLDINNGAKFVFDYGDGAEFTLDADSNNVQVYCTIMSAYSGSVDMYFNPMISDPSLNLSYDDYVPYAMTNRELTEKTVTTGTTALSNSGTDYELIEGFIYKKNGVNILRVAVKCVTPSPISGGSHIKFSALPSGFPQPPAIIYTTIPCYRDGTTNVAAELQISTNGDIAIRGGEAGARYSGLFAF